MTQTLPTLVRELISLASNMKSIDENPAFTREQFLEVYPQFTSIPEAIVNFYIGLANSSLSYARWGDQWVFGMTLYVAHFLTLYLQATNNLNANSPAFQVLQNSYSQGLVASKSAGSLSKSYDYGSINDDLKGWAAWKLTAFGQQFATIAKLIGKGGSLIW